MTSMGRGAWKGFWFNPLMIPFAIIYVVTSPFRVLGKVLTRGKSRE